MKIYFTFFYSKFHFQFYSPKTIILFRGFPIDTEIAQSSDVAIRISVLLALDDRLSKRGVPAEDQDGHSGELGVLPDDPEDKLRSLVAAVELPVPVGDDPDLV